MLPASIHAEFAKCLRSGRQRCDGGGQPTFPGRRAASAGGSAGGPGSRRRFAAMAHRVAPLGNIGEDEEVEGEDPEESKEMARLELGADASPLPSQTPRSVRTKLSSDLMKHALNKARHNKTGMEYSGGDAARRRALRVVGLPHGRRVRPRDDPAVHAPGLRLAQLHERLPGFGGGARSNPSRGRTSRPAPTASPTASTGAGRPSRPSSRPSRRAAARRRTRRSSGSSAALCSTPRATRRRSSATSTSSRTTCARPTGTNVF